MKPFITLLLLSLSVFADEACDDFRLIDENLIRLGQHFNWNAATTSHVERAPCKSKTLPSLSSVLNKSGNASGEIHGVRFENESPELLTAFRELTTMRDYFGSKPRPDEQINIQARHGVNPNCKKVLCAMDKIWGRGLGSKLLYLKLKHGFNASEYSISGAKRITEDELNDVLLAMSDLPPHLSRIALPNQQISRISKDPLDQTGKSEANAMMMLYDLWAQNPPSKRQYVVFHELAHNISHHLGELDSSREWLSLAGWEKYGHEWETNENHCQVSRYGSTNPDEDFAETLSAYRYNAHDLKNRCPHKYDFMKAFVFNNHEYLDQNCREK